MSIDGQFFKAKHIDILTEFPPLIIFLQKCSKASKAKSGENDITSKGAGSFHIHCKTMKDLWILAVLGVREQPNLAHNLVTYRH